MNLKNITQTAFIFLLSISVYAGNGSSGGGHIHTEQQNPWFFQNSKTVSYCIKKSKRFHFISEERLDDLIQESFNFWKIQFSNVDFPSLFFHPYDPFPKVATQDFIQISNCKKASIRFQFGVLSRREKKKIGNLEKKIGIAYRENYDKQNMQGSGFVYIAPESGPMRPKSHQLAKQPWSTNDNMGLRLALMHEVGHIFGLADHQASGKDLMSIGFLESVTRIDTQYLLSSLSEKNIELSKYFKPLGYGLKPTFYTFGFESVIPSQLTNKEVNKALGIDDKIYNGIMVKGLGKIIEIYLIREEEDDEENDITVAKKLLGKIKLPKIHTHIARTQTALPSSVAAWFPKEQTVFKLKMFGKHELKKDDPWRKGLIESPVSIIPIKRSIILNNLDLKLSSGKTVKINVTLGSTRTPTFSMAINGNYHPDIFSQMSRPDQEY
ncbi:hypothetical protein N9N67_11370 [Bacteriovoracaceae bacterium]|nr:hypothetical protein [Bacteriovoracaceae bacterium]